MTWGPNSWVDNTFHIRGDVCVVLLPSLRYEYFKSQISYLSPT